MAKKIYKPLSDGTLVVRNVNHLMQLVAEKKPFYLSQNSPKGNVIKPIDWDGKELTDDAYKLIKEKIGCRYLAFVDFEIGDCKGTIICDEEGLCKKLEINDSASYLAKEMLVGDVIVGFPD